MDDDLHWLHILQDAGGGRIPHSPCRVELIDCRTRAAFPYDRKHEILPEGAYALVFTDADRCLIAVQTLRLTSALPEDVWYVFRWEQATRRFTGGLVTEARAERLTKAGRLRKPT